MNTRQINRIVNAAYGRLDMINDLTMRNWRNRIFDAACEEERGHRRGAPLDWTWPKGASVAAAARLFTVKRIAEALIATGERRLTIKDVINTQMSAILAASVVANYGAQCMTALGREHLGELAALDYVYLINDGAPQS